MYTCECLCVGLRMWVQYHCRPQEGIRFPGAGSDKGCEPSWGCWGPHLGPLKSGTYASSLSQLSSPLWWYLNACQKLWKGIDHVSLTSPCSVLSAGWGIELKLMFEVLVPIPSIVGSLVPPLSSLFGSESPVAYCSQRDVDGLRVCGEKCFRKHSNAVKG